MPKATGYVSMRHASYLSSWKVRQAFKAHQAAVLALFSLAALVLFLRSLFLPCTCPVLALFLRLTARGSLGIPQTRWVVLTGNYLRTFRSQDFANANKTLYLAGCELKETPAKYHFKVKPLGKKKGYEIRTRDKRDFELWKLALHQAQVWKDPREGTQPPPPLSRGGSDDSLDDMDDGGEGGPGALDADVEPIPTHWTSEQYAKEARERKIRLTTSIQGLHQIIAKLDKKLGSDAAPYARVGTGRRRAGDGPGRAWDGRGTRRGIGGA